MRVAVITPYVGEATEVITRSTASIAAQHCPGAELTQILVSDGAPPPPLPKPSGALHRIEAICLPSRVGDGGSTPRAVGSAYALGTGAEAIAFLDVDNRFTTDHIHTMLNWVEEGAELVSATRWLCHHDTGERMYVDTVDSDGDQFTDPSCLFFAGAALPLTRQWGMRDPSGRAVRNTMHDRAFWAKIRARVPEAKRRVAERATVEYRTPWLGHYRVGIDLPPQRLKLAVQRPDGTLESRWVRVLGSDGRSWRVDLDPPPTPPDAAPPARSR